MNLMSQTLYPRAAIREGLPRIPRRLVPNDDRAISEQRQAREQHDDQGKAQERRPAARARVRRPRDAEFPAKPLSPPVTLLSLIASDHGRRYPNAIVMIR